MNREIEILESKLDQSELEFFGDKLGNPLSAMQELARERSIGFAEWKDRLYTHSHRKELGEKYYENFERENSDSELTYYTLDQLYDLYLSQLKSSIGEETEAQDELSTLKANIAMVMRTTECCKEDRIIADIRKTLNQNL